MILCLVSCGSNQIAQEVHDYEQKLKEEVDKKSELNPQYIYNYAKVERVCCTYELKDDTDSKKIINKYNMVKKFSCGEVSDLGSINMIMIIFDREDFTPAIARKIKNIKNMESQIINLMIEFDTDFSSQQFPNINYYAKEAISITYNDIIEQRHGSWPFEERVVEGHIIKTKEEYDNYLNNLLELEYRYTYFDITIEAIEYQRDLYDEEFFEENALILTRLMVRGSGSIRLKIMGLYVDDSKVYVVVESTNPEIGTCDNQYTFFALQVKKSDVINVTEVITLE